MPNTSTALVGYVDGLSAVAGQLDKAQADLTAVLSERSAAASLLSALQAKASSLGHATAPGLVELSALLGRRLAESPVVLPVVHQLLEAYTAQLDYLARSRR